MTGGASRAARLQGEITSLPKKVSGGEPGRQDGRNIDARCDDYSGSARQVWHSRCGSWNEHGINEMHLRPPNVLAMNERLSEPDKEFVAELNASLLHLDGLRAVEINPTGPFARSKIAWKLVTYQPRASAQDCRAGRWSLGGVECPVYPRRDPVGASVYGNIRSDGRI